METHLSGARNTAIGASEYNRTWAGLSTGPRLRYAAEIAGRRRPGLLLADLGVERRWRGGEGYTSGLWAGIGVEQTIDRNWRAGGFPRVWTTLYDEGTDADNPRGRSLDLHVARRIGDGWLTVGGKVSRESPERRDLRWTSRAASLRYATTVGRDWSLSAGAGLTRTSFDAVAPLFLTRREDRTHDIGITASHRQARLGRLSAGTDTELVAHRVEHPALRPRGAHAAARYAPAVLIEKGPNAPAIDAHHGFRTAGSALVSPWLLVYPTCQSAERPAKYPPITAGDYMVEKFASQASGEEWSDEDSRKFGTADTESRFTQ